MKKSCPVNPSRFDKSAYVPSGPVNLTIRSDVRVCRNASWICRLLTTSVGGASAIVIWEIVMSFAGSPDPPGPTGGIDRFSVLAWL